MGLWGCSVVVKSLLGFYCLLQICQHKGSFISTTIGLVDYFVLCACVSNKLYSHFLKCCTRFPVQYVQCFHYNFVCYLLCAVELQDIYHLHTCLQRSTNWQTIIHAWEPITCTATHEAPPTHVFCYHRSKDINIMLSGRKNIQLVALVLGSICSWIPVNFSFSPNQYYECLII